jgi:hypothetical protein
MPPKKHQEVAAGSHPLLHLLRRQKLGDPTGGLLNEAQIFLQDGVNGANRKLMRGGKFPNHYPPVFLNGGGDRSQNVAGPLRLLGAGVALISGVFALLNSLNDTVYLAF